MTRAYKNPWAWLKGCVVLALAAGKPFLGAQPITITEINRDNGQLVFAWTGGGGTYRIEQSASLGEGVWEAVADQVEGNQYAVGADNEQGFFRVIDVPPPPPPMPPPPPPSLPFGCEADDADCVDPRFPPWCFGVPQVSEWKDADGATDTLPLSFDFWTGPYQNKAGYDAVQRVNAWYAEGMAAGLSQDTFRSFDGGHSAIRDFYPQLPMLEPLLTYDAECRDVFGRGVTMGVQSLSVAADGLGSGLSVLDFNALAELVFHYHPAEYRRLVGQSSPVFTFDFYREFYEGNMLLVSPAVNSFREVEGEEDDRFTFLSPYYLASFGASGTDSRLLKPVLFAAASLPPALKTRVLRMGAQVPLLTWLFKHALSDDLRSVAAHQVAYRLPAEADVPPPERQVREDGSMESARDAYERVEPESAPFLEQLLELANGLEHVPPMARLEHVTEPQIVGGNYDREPFLRTDPYGVQAALRPGERLMLDLDLSFSWSDQRHLSRFYVGLLKDPAGGASVDESNLEAGRVTIEIPWQEVETPGGRRTDIVCLVNDGVWDSVPAYISVRHLQTDERERFAF